jgi:hypothetical protein
VDIQDGIREHLEQRTADEAHVTRKTDEPDVARLERGGDRSIVVVARPERTMVDVAGFDASLPRPIETRSVVSIRNNDRDGCIQTAVADGVDERLEIAAAPRDEDAKAPVHERFV